MRRRAGELLEEYDVRGGDPELPAASLSGGNQQKVCIAREIASNPKLLIAHQPTRGLDVGAIEFVHRRLCRERDSGRGILLVSLEFEEVRSLADRILVIYEGEIVGEFPPDVTEEELGIAMTGGGGRPDRRVSRRGGHRKDPQTPASRLAAYVRGGGVIVPLITVLIAFVIGGLVVLLTGNDPLATYEAIFKGTGLQWLFPWTTGEDRTIAALNLQQTLIITTPLILTGLAVAFAFRAGLFNIGGQGQYIIGSIAAVWVGSSFAACRPSCTSCWRSSRRSRPARSGPGSPAC